MFDCPKCRTSLVRCQNEFGNFWHCGSCGGTAITVSLLRKFVDRGTVNELWQGARQRENPRKCACPGCESQMEEVPVETPVGTLLIDICDHCQFIWLDGGEWDELPHVAVAAEKPEPELPMELRERIAIEQIKRIEAQHDVETGQLSEGPSEVWQWIPAILGMPVEESQPSLGERPWVTWSLALVIFVVSVFALFELRPAIDAFGLIPAQVWRLGGLTLLTSFFLHGGVLHLLGNLYFLVIFGDNVESCLGRLKFFALVLAAALFGDFVHIAMDAHSMIPCIGASGGISGVIAFYALRFPKTRLSLMFLFFFRVYWFRMKAIWMFGLWILMQFFIASQQMDGLSDVSGGAHLGGALVGFVAWLIWRFSGAGVRPHDSRA
jgi:membrane associated rhomboid family serine protease/Zn-finger nucleic acid-binding protein